MGTQLPHQLLLLVQVRYLVGNRINPPPRGGYWKQVHCQRNNTDGVMLAKRLMSVRL